MAAEGMYGYNLILLIHRSLLFHYIQEKVKFKSCFNRHYINIPNKNIKQPKLIQ
jgi:hypothetical protein